MTFGGAGDAAAVQRLVEMGHLDELILDVAGLGGAVIVGGHGGGADQHVAHAYLAPAVALAVVTGEAFHQHTGELCLAVKEDTVIGHEHIVKYGQGFHTAEFGVSYVHLSVFQLAGIAALAAHDQEQAGRVQGYGEGYGVILILGPHGDGGHHDDLVGIQDAGLVRLGAADHDAVGTALHHMQEQIGILLSVRCLTAVALGIGHGAVDGQIVPLTVYHKLLEVFVIVGAVFLIHLIGSGEYSIEGVHTHAALEAGGGHLAAQALHLHLVAQIVSGLMDMGETVDPLSGIGGDHGHQILILRHLGQIIGHADGVQGRTQDRIFGGIFDLLAEHIDLHIDLLDGFDVLLACHKCHDCFLLMYQ